MNSYKNKPRLDTIPEVETDENINDEYFEKKGYVNKYKKYYIFAYGMLWLYLFVRIYKSKYNLKN